MVALGGGILIVDGYNIIGAWEELRELKKTDLGSSRSQLIDLLTPFRPLSWSRIIVVFDGRDFAWEEMNGVEVVYSGSRESADALIERLAAGLAAAGSVEVATSDGAEYRAASALGAFVLTAGRLRERLEEERQHCRRHLCRPRPERGGLALGDRLGSRLQADLARFCHQGEKGQKS